MPEAKRSGSGPPRSLSADQREEYRILLLLERLESLVEEMDELEVSTRADAEARLRQLHSQLDAEA